MTEKIIILDFGSQVTQLIGRRLREIGVYCEIYPYNKVPSIDESVKGIILSGSPCSVRDGNAPQVDLKGIKGWIPLLGICYGAQYLAQKFGGEVEASAHREYGRAMMDVKDPSSPLLKGVSPRSQVWMSHGDTITRLPEGARVIASTDDVRYAAFSIDGEQTYAVQFHPEVYHTTEGSKMLENFAKGICGCEGGWTPASFIETTVEALRKKIGDERVILGLSGGVDSTVAAVLLNKAIGDRLTCIFVNNGLLRKNEFSDVMASYKDMGLNVIGADASQAFLYGLKGVADPEQKRKIIGKLFVDTFYKYARTIENAAWLAQGTIYPDVIESAGIPGIASKIKSHHNVGGLPADMKLKIVEYSACFSRTRSAESAPSESRRNLSEDILFLALRWRSESSEKSRRRNLTPCARRMTSSSRGSAPTTAPEWAFLQPRTRGSWPRTFTTPSGRPE